MKDLGCVYSITNTINHKIYIGQTVNFKKRIYEHKRTLKLNKHKNKYLQNDYNEFGLSAFTFQLEYENLNREDRLKKETELINFYGGIESDNVYNFQDNITENKEMRRLVSEHQKGKIIKQESIDKMRKKLTGRHLSEAHKQAIKKASAKFIGDNNPAKRVEVRAKISEAVKGEKNGFYGKHHTKEARESIRQSRLGKSPGNKGKSISNETKSKISYGVRLSKIKNGQVDVEQMKQFYKEFKLLGSYKAVSLLHPELPYRKVRSIILRCNDYLEIE